MITVHAAPGALQAAFDSLPQTDEPALVLLENAEYREKCVLSRPYTTVRGEEDTCIVWGDGAYDLMPDGTKRGTFRTATLMVDAHHVTLQRLTIKNEAWPREKAGQAIALYADGKEFLCEDCRLLSCQDTLFTAPLPLKEMQPGGFIGPKQFAPRVPQKHTYRRCLIQGDIDFIFGGAEALFEECEIRSVDGREDQSQPCFGYATAASTPENQAAGYVFLRCRFTSDHLPPASVYLGRPWRNFAQTELIDCYLGEHIHPDGFHDWNKPEARATMRYVRTGCYGPGAPGALPLGPGRG